MGRATWIYFNDRPVCRAPPSGPYKFIGFGVIDVTKPYKCIWFGDIDAPKPYEFIGSGGMSAIRVSPASRAHPGTGYALDTPGSRRPDAGGDTGGDEGAELVKTILIAY